MSQDPNNIFVQGAISPEVIRTAIAELQIKTEIGAHAMFLGQVRADEIDGKEVTGIEYSAYESMALSKFQEIRTAAFEKFDIRSMQINHSMGLVPTGEICLFVLVASPHRRVAFEASEFVVEKIKAEVPVFGKELLDDTTHQWKVNN